MSKISYFSLTYLTIFLWSMFVMSCGKRAESTSSGSSTANDRLIYSERCAVPVKPETSLKDIFEKKLGVTDEKSKKEIEEKAKPLVEALGSPKFATRDEAKKELLKIGFPVLSTEAFLNGLKSTDPEVTSKLSSVGKFLVSSANKNLMSNLPRNEISYNVLENLAKLILSKTKVTQSKIRDKDQFISKFVKFVVNDPDYQTFVGKNGKHYWYESYKSFYASMCKFLNEAYKNKFVLTLKECSEQPSFADLNRIVFTVAEGDVFYFDKGYLSFSIEAIDGQQEKTFIQDLLTETPEGIHDIVSRKAGPCFSDAPVDKFELVLGAYKLIPSIGDKVPGFAQPVGEVVPRFTVDEGRYPIHNSQYVFTEAELLPKLLKVYNPFNTEYGQTLEKPTGRE